MSQAVEQRNRTWIIFSVPQKVFSIFFHKFDMYFIVLLRYFCNISNKPIIMINTSNVYPWHKVINIRSFLDSWNGDIWRTLSSRNDSHFQVISYSNKMMANSWALKAISRRISFLQRKFCDMILDIINFDENSSWYIVYT